MIWIERPSEELLTYAPDAKFVVKHRNKRKGINHGNLVYSLEDAIKFFLWELLEIPLKYLYPIRTLKRKINTKRYGKEIH